MGKRNGDWFFFGAGSALFAQQMLHLDYGWVILGALAIGWFINEQERKRNAEAP